MDIESNVDPNSFIELTELLGEGSYGAVYKAVDSRSGEEVAVKILPAEEDITELEKEIKFLKQLTCPLVVGYFGCYLWDNELWILMEYCAGGSVSDIVDAANVRFTEPQIAAIMAYVMLGLEHLHSHRSIHRDLKAGNVLIASSGACKLADFGVSAQITTTMGKRKTVIGTPFWMAPEVIQETSYDFKADIWSAGITAIELADGHPPLFNVHPMRAIFMIPMKPPPTVEEPSAWSDELNDFIASCLQKDPDQRPTAAALLSHPFLQNEVARIQGGDEGCDLIAQIITDNWEAIERFRLGEEEGEEGE